jgi:hypothetical protein
MFTQFDARTKYGSSIGIPDKPGLRQICWKARATPSSLTLVRGYSLSLKGKLTVIVSLLSFYLSDLARISTC